ncbi:flagellar basal body P-ring formation chaperone FlgA [Phytobacter massiliensis]|uniref:flagellar basal body P-ring formation chaperone FlgA n=1 Tax=Phytobacter massiliensis TaxID=1485952 RepID=UPI0005C4FA53|nr:flagellar basal body P-ring formation chaperone FlgA [Phytobacter massiliensis]
MRSLFTRRKTFFRMAVTLAFASTPALTAFAATQPVQHSAREQINALVLSAASRQIDALAQKARWHDYRYTFNVFIPSAVANDPLCPSAPRINAASPAQTALSRMNFEVNCPGNGGWKVNVSVRPDVYVPVVMPKSLIQRDTVISADDVQLKKYDISSGRGELLMDLSDVVGLTSKRTLQPGKPLTRAQLQEPLLVKRDQPVTIVTHMGGITASMPGVALKNGRKGEVIKIRNATSQRIISGVVDDSGVVTTLTSVQ